jgi:hypothetical protein
MGGKALACSAVSAWADAVDDRTASADRTALDNSVRWASMMIPRQVMAVGFRIDAEYARQNAIDPAWSGIRATAINGVMLRDKRSGWLRPVRNEVVRAVKSGR